MILSIQIQGHQRDWDLILSNTSNQSSISFSESHHTFRIRPGVSIPNAPDGATLSQIHPYLNLSFHLVNNTIIF